MLLAMSGLALDHILAPTVKRKKLNRNNGENPTKRSFTTKLATALTLTKRVRFRYVRTIYSPYPRTKD